MNYPSDNKLKQNKNPPNMIPYLNGVKVIFSEQLKPPTSGIKRKKLTLNKWTKRYRSELLTIGFYGGDIYSFQNMLIMNEKTYKMLHKFI
jgi:hypothetical protein